MKYQRISGKSGKVELEIDGNDVPICECGGNMKIHLMFYQCKKCLNSYLGPVTD